MTYVQLYEIYGIPTDIRILILRPPDFRYPFHSMAKYIICPMLPSLCYTTLADRLNLLHCKIIVGERCFA